MNIVLYVNSCLPDLGGREFVVHYLASALLDLGHEVRVLGPAGWWRHRGCKFEYPVHRYPTIEPGKGWRDTRPGRLQSPVAALRTVVHESIKQMQLLLDTSIWGCDVIHAHNTYPTGYFVARLKRLLGVPLVITPHGEDIHVLPEIGFGLRLNTALDAKIRFALERANILTAISASVEKSLLEAGAQQERIRLIPNGVDIDRFARIVNVDVRRLYRLPADARLIVTVGNYHPRKGHEILIQAMPAILVKEPRARLVIVGRNQEALRPLVADLNLEDRVMLVGPIGMPPQAAISGARDDAGKEDVLAALLQASELYVSAGAGEGAEGLSLALLEAMAAGLPVVATNISGNKDIVEDGYNGLLVEAASPAALAEGVCRLFANDLERLRIGENARSVARRYHWREIARRYVDVYKEARSS